MDGPLSRHQRYAAGEYAKALHRHAAGIESRLLLHPDNASASANSIRTALIFSRDYAQAAICGSFAKWRMFNNPEPVLPLEIPEEFCVLILDAARAKSRITSPGAQDHINIVIVELEAMLANFSAETHGGVSY